ncbi:alpha/beta hydrolase-fold protein [Pseudoalteromonas sp. A25]|uniref:alpha/beta hydrolase-fold protein n=1 Tax=Pseudoalteromonas sp. A25 TaxID=116092 RepID=UPI00156276BB|nr:alpha/beta hydrolase-fold protein [Pseudoalteromonas sp. A25]
MFRLIATVILFLSFSVNAQDIKIGETQVLKSEVLNESREYYISFPKSYDKNNYTSYPVLYLLDGDMHSFFQVFSGMVNQMSVDASPTIPEMIVVGIASQNRVRDSSPTNSLTQYGGKTNDALSVTGGADKFIQFIKEELIPTINRKYRTSDYKVLVGYSFTGLPVIQSLYTTPETFNAYMAIDPSMWWDNQYMLKQLTHFYKKPALDKRRLFIATTERVTEVYPKENYVAEFIKRLTNKSKDGLYFDSITFGKDENHHTMQVLSFYKGLRSVFEGYMIDDHARFRSAKALETHFYNLSNKLGAKFQLREDLLNWFGYERLYNNQFVDIDVNRAVEFFELNTQYYPLSSNAWDSLGEGYMIQGNDSAALISYEKSLQLNPNNKNAQEKIAQLKSKLN